MTQMLQYLSSERVTSVGSILISSVYPAADAVLCVLERWAGISSDEHLMKDQRDLESTGVSLTHKARSRVSSKDTPKSSREARHYPVTATFCSPAMSHLSRHRTKSQTESQRWREQEWNGDGEVKRNKRMRFTFRQIDSLSDYWRAGGMMNCRPAQVINVNIRK